MVREGGEAPMWSGDPEKDNPVEIEESAKDIHKGGIFAGLAAGFRRAAGIKNEVPVTPPSALPNTALPADFSFPTPDNSDETDGTLEEGETVK